MSEVKSAEQIRMEVSAAAWERQAERPIRDRIADLLRSHDASEIVRDVEMYAGNPWTDCGGQTSDPPCGGCSACLVAQGIHYLPEREVYLGRADRVLSEGYSAQRPDDEP